MILINEHDYFARIVVDSSGVAEPDPYSDLGFFYPPTGHSLTRVIQNDPEREKFLKYK
jgi:G3E family GTPase